MKKKCWCCKTPKAIHFYSKAEWTKNIPMCTSCRSKENKGRPKRR